MPTNRRLLSALLVSALALAACANQTDGSAAWAPASIVGGTPGGDPAVVWVMNRQGGMCTGTLIDPRVVLTAKHCVQTPGAEEPSAASAMLVGFGDRARLGRTVRVQSVHTTPGVYYSDGFLTGLRGVDVATLVLSTAVTDVTPIPVRRGTPTDLEGQTITATGFGETPSGRVGEKFSATGVVTSVDGDLISVGSLICSGDSGGPMVTAEREVVGVVSYGPDQACGSSYGVYNALHNYLHLVDVAVEEGGGCFDHGSEWCDGRDNDCDGEVDEGCLALGDPCDTDEQCIGTTCRETTAGRICTEACNALTPAVGCSEGSYCSRAEASACEGWCVPSTTTGALLANDAPCERDDECASRYCTDPGDGEKRCLSSCQGDAGACFAGEVCVAPPGSCGGCVAAELVDGAHGLGEPCGGDGDCGSGVCHQDGDARYCSRACDDTNACPSQYHCRAGLCVRGRLAGPGETCAVHEDCVNETACAVQGDRRWCTYPCSESSPCQEGFTCVPTASGVNACEPDRGVLGEACGAGEECISGSCVEGRCTRECGPDSACGVGFECRRTEDGSGQCVRPVPASAGCAVGAGAGSGSGALVIALAGLALALRRRVRS